MGIPRMEWKALVETAQGLGHGLDLPAEITEENKTDEDFLRKVHHILMEIEIMEGNLICPETSRKFPVSKGIPNMLLTEDEVKVGCERAKTWQRTEGISAVLELISTQGKYD